MAGSDDSSLHDEPPPVRNARPVEIESGVFVVEVLGLVRLAIWIETRDADVDGFKGVQFLGWRNDDDLSHYPDMRLVIGDVTIDSGEPDVDRLTDTALGEADNWIRRDVEQDLDGMRLSVWTPTHLVELGGGPNVSRYAFLTEFALQEGERQTTVNLFRYRINGRKVLVQLEWPYGRAADLGEHLSKSLRTLRAAPSIN